MQNVIRKVALARNQAKRKAILSTKYARRKDWNEFLKGQFSYNRAHLDNIRNERQRRQEDWARGPLAPRRDSGMDGKPFGAFGLDGGLKLPEIPKHMRRKFINFAKGDRVCIMKGREKGKISEITNVEVESESVTLKDLNLVWFYRSWCSDLLHSCSILTDDFHSAKFVFPVGWPGNPKSEPLLIERQHQFRLMISDLSFL